MKKEDVWDWIIWIAIASIILWSLGKMFGFIQSPPYVEFFPYLSFGVVLAGVFMKAGKIVENVDNLNKRVDKLEDRFDNVESRLIKLENG